MKISVLGANGFVGLALCQHLATYENIELCCFSRTISPALQQLEKYNSVKIIQGDYFQKESILPAIEGADIVFHLIYIIWNKIEIGHFLYFGHVILYFIWRAGCKSAHLVAGTPNSSNDK